MKKFFPVILIILEIKIFAQVVVTFPEFPTENDSIIVRLNTAQPGAEELLGYAGTIYAHTGVNTAQADWQHVIGGWGNNVQQPALTKINDSLYQLTVGYPRVFYNVIEQGEKINALALVFRSADASKQTRPDIFINLYEPGLNIVINNPEVDLRFDVPLRSPVFAEAGDTIDIEISAVEIGTEVTSLTLYINDVEKVSAGEPDLNYEFIAADYPAGPAEIKVVGIDTSGAADTVNFAIMINPPVTDVPLPPGIEHGINYVDNSTVTLALFAPYKEFIYLIGDFNDWQVNTNYLMNRYEVRPDSVVWWITINALTPSEEYAFQYLVDGSVRIGDPYSEKVLDPWNDQSISDTTYPDLKDYPEGKTAEPVSVLQTNSPAYNWQNGDFQRPEKTDLVIYELLLRDYLAEQNYQTLEDTLSYLKTLGVNAIELMPVMEFEGNQSWGYNPSFHLALDKNYGTPNAFKSFIDKAHEMGIAVILDIVLNHAFGQSPLVRLYWDTENSRPAQDNPWFNPVARHPFNVGYDFNHESSATKYFTDRVNKFWLEEYNIDGFRFDLSKGITQTNSGDNVSLWGQYDQSRINLLKRMADKIRETDSSAYIILEHFANNNEEVVLSDYGMMLWGNMNYDYNEATMGYQSDMNWASYKARNWSDPHLVAYMESHDEERLMFKNLRYGNANGGYDVKDPVTALNRIKLAAAFFFSIPGPKMIWQFGELGYDFSINYPCNTSQCRLSPKPPVWDYKDDPERLKLYKVFSALINLKKNYDAFRSNDFTADLSSFRKRIHINHAAMNATILGNFNVVPANIEGNFQNPGWWYDYFSGDSLNVTDVSQAFLFQPGEFRIYTTVKLPQPEEGIATDADSEESENVVAEYQLVPNYPNPFNPATEITFHLPEPGKVILKIYDMLGKEIRTLVNEEKSSGIYKVRWNGDNNSGKSVASGIYICRIEVNTFVSSRKMILLR